MAGWRQESGLKLDLQQLEKENNKTSSAGIRLVDVASGHEVGQRVWKGMTDDPPDDFNPYSLALSPDGKLLATAVPKLKNKQVTGWQIKFSKLPGFELQTRTLEWPLEPQSPRIVPGVAMMLAQAAFSPDGQRIGWRSQESSMRDLEFADGRVESPQPRRSKAADGFF